VNVNESAPCARHHSRRRTPPSLPRSAWNTCLSIIIKACSSLTGY
jgi:hypothetical protein